MVYIYELLIISESTWRKFNCWSKSWARTCSSVIETWKTWRSGVSIKAGKQATGKIHASALNWCARLRSTASLTRNRCSKISRFYWLKRNIAITKLIANSKKLIQSDECAENHKFAMAKELTPKQAKHQKQTSAMVAKIRNMKKIKDTKAKVETMLIIIKSINAIISNQPELWRSPFITSARSSSMERNSRPSIWKASLRPASCLNFWNAKKPYMNHRTTIKVLARRTTDRI